MKDEMLIRPQPPCQDCKDRTEDCHGNCTPYEQYQIAAAEYNQEVARRKKSQYIGYTKQPTKSELANLRNERKRRYEKK